jgi:hypothetical protein
MVFPPYSMPLSLNKPPRSSRHTPITTQITGYWDY